MTDLPDSSHSASQPSATLAADLLRHYSFELGQYGLAQQIEIWLEYYPSPWLPTAIIEALYQGRYKAISVEQILNLWQRRGHPVYHFNHEFERLVCGNLPRPPEPDPPKEFHQLIPASSKPGLSYRKMLLELPSVRAASRLDRLSEIPSLKLALTRPTNRALEVDYPVTGPNGTEEPCEKTATPPAIAVGKNGKLTPPSNITDREFKEFKEGVVFGLSSGLAVHALKPRFRLELSQHYKPDWLTFLTSNPSIDQFTPEVDDPSEFHSKLKAVVQPGHRGES
uniref:Uncharacterized protein n=1 Tax=Oscillatoriales cyanobacterium SpSt-402 TaxID=2282168 RepID=A0A832M5A5_9CYAN